MTATVDRRLGLIYITAGKAVNLRCDKDAKTRNDGAILSVNNFKCMYLGSVGKV